MFIRIFQKSHWYTPLLLLLVAAILWMDAFLYPERALETISGTGFGIYELLLPAMIVYPTASIILAFLMLNVQVFLLNYAATTKGFTDRYAALPGLVYLLLMSSTEGMIAPHPVLFANLFLIPVVIKLFNAYEGEHIIKEVFNISFLTALSSLFFFPALAFFLVVIVSVFIYYIVNLRRIIGAFIGLLTPYFFFFMYFFMHEGIFHLPSDLSVSIQIFSVFDLDINMFEQFFIVLLSLLSVFSILRLQLVYKATKPIRIRKRISMLLIVLLFSVLSYMLSIDNIHVHYGIIVIPLSIALSVFFYDFRHNRFSELLFGLFVLMVLVSRFSGYYVS